MQIKNNFNLSAKKLFVLLIISALIGGGIIYLTFDNISKGTKKYQEWKNKKQVGFFEKLRDNFKTKEPKNMQSVKIIDEQSQVIEVVKKASPAVVSIVASAQVPKFETYFEDPFFGDDFSPFFNFRIPQQRQNGTEEKKIGAGTGFVVSSDGYIITNKHVVNEEDADYTVYLNDEKNRGEKIKAKVVARDPKNDLAVLKIDKRDLPFLTFSDSSHLQVGQTVITIGYALGEFDNTVSKGVISGLSRSITAGGGFTKTEELKNLIQSDAAINPGNSGGPMLDIEGNVIGINVAMANAENIGFAISGNEAKAVFEEVKNTGSISKKETAFLGVRYVLIDEKLKADNNLPYEYGALVARGETRTDLAVIPGSPADKAGIMENDIILEVNGQKITKRNQLSDLIATKKPNEEINLKIYHKGEEEDLKIVLGKN